MGIKYKKYYIGGNIIGHKECDTIEEVKEFINDALTKASENFTMLNDKITFIIRPEEKTK